MFSKTFLTDLLERAISTFAQAYGAAAVVVGHNVFDLTSLKVAGGAAVLAVLKAVAASYKGDPQTASLVG